MQSDTQGLCTRSARFRIVGSKECHTTGRLLIELEQEPEKTRVCKFILDIVTDDHLLQGFSPTDIRLLTILACQRPALYPILKRIIAYETDVNSQALRVHVADSVGKPLTTVSVRQLARAQHLLAEFSPQDAYRIGYLHGQE